MVVGITLYFTFFQKGGVDREANARHVIEVMCTYPDTRYFDPGAITYIGEGVVTTPEEKEKIKAANEKIRQNWEDAVGSYFAPNCFDPCYGMGLTAYLGSAYGKEQTSTSVKDITLISQEEKAQTFAVAIVVDGVEKQSSIRFCNDENSLFTFVEIQEMSWNPLT